MVSNYRWLAVAAGRGPEKSLVTLAANPPADPPVLVPETVQLHMLG